MRRGVSLVELVVVIGIIALLAGITFPAAWRAYDAIVAERTAQAVVAAHRVARFSAIMRNCRTLLTILPESVIVRAIEKGDTLTIWTRAGAAADGVLLTAPSRALAFAPTGIPLGVANATVRLERGSAIRRVIISRLGRTRIERR
jgi:prepilin-type N-terminal cleavage/methylation domain-containing protein